MQQELEGSDAALLMLNGEQGVGPGDRFIAQALADASVPVTIAVNKVDRLSKAALLDVPAAGRASSTSGAEVFPISARTGTGVEALVEHLAGADARGAVHVRARTRSPTSRSSCCWPS